MSAARGAVLVVLLALAMSGRAATNGLTDGDYRYLKAEFGLGKDSFTLTNIGADDAAKLHDAISGPAAKQFPQGRNFDVADLLFDVEMRTCQSWQLAHAASSCPQVADPQLKPGWEIAECWCIACHLTWVFAWFDRVALSSGMSILRS